MQAISAGIHFTLFAMICVAGWLIFPVLIIGGGAILLAYALIAELAESLGVVKAPPLAERLPRTP